VNRCPVCASYGPGKRARIEQAGALSAAALRQLRAEEGGPQWRARLRADGWPDAYVAVRV
jgi:hypothetical protein